MTQRTKSNMKSFVVGMFIGATVFVLAANMGGCSTLAGGLSGAVHGLADDLDGLTDKMSKDKQDREANQRGRW